MPISETDLEKIKERVVRERGYWGPLQASLAHIDPAWIDIYLDFVNAPDQYGRISQRLQHLIYVAVDASTTHLFQRGLGQHILLSHKHGATREEIFEVLQLTLELYSISPKVGLPILKEELRRAGLSEELGPAIETTPEQQQLKKQFIDKLGFWPEWLDDLLRSHPAYAQSYMKIALNPWVKGALPPKEKALISIAVYAAPTTVHEPSLREHIRHALALGATAAEITDVIQLASGIGLHTMSVGAPAFVKMLDGIDLGG
jgi:alkylhydroperoxidase/carboxymuconolactone decarboxylase family protein YurZ